MAKKIVTSTIFYSTENFLLNSDDIPYWSKVLSSATIYKNTFSSQSLRYVNKGAGFLILGERGGWFQIMFYVPSEGRCHMGAVRGDIIFNEAGSPSLGETVANPVHTGALLAAAAPTVRKHFQKISESLFKVFVIWYIMRK